MSKQLSGHVLAKEQQDAQEAVRQILKYIGEDITREGLVDTPKRYLKFLKEFTTPENFNLTTFKNEGIDEMIIVKDIPFFSFCEHHVAPFFGTGCIAYIPNNEIVGISKLPRTLKMFAGRLQNQERITQQVVEFLMDKLKPKGVACSLSARHMCMEMRGVKTHDAQTITTALAGVFKESAVKNEFFQAIRQK